MKAGPKPQPIAGELPKLRARTPAGRVRPKGRGTKISGDLPKQNRGLAALERPQVTQIAYRRARMPVVPRSGRLPCLSAIARVMDAQHGALEVADIEAQGRILEAAMPAYQQLVNEAARQAFLADLRRRGVFQTTMIPERERQ